MSDKVYENEVSYNKGVSYEELAVELLNKKYDDFFEVERVQSHSYFRGYYTVIAYKKENPDLLFRAYVDSDGAGISDNYIAKWVCHQIADRVAQNLDALSGIYYISADTVMDIAALNNTNITIEEFVKEYPKTKYMIHVHFCPEETTAEEVYRGFGNAFHDLESITGKIYLYIVDETMLAKVQEYTETYDKYYDDYKTMMENYSVGLIEFENGKIKTTKEEFIKMLENRV